MSNLNGHYLIYRDDFSALHRHGSVGGGDFLHRAGDRAVLAAVLASVRHEIPDGDLRMLVQPRCNFHEPTIQLRDFLLVQLEPRLRLPPDLFDYVFVSGQRGEGGELRCAVAIYINSLVVIHK